MGILEQIKENKIVPVAVFANAEETRRCLSEMEKGGFHVVEICFRNEYAGEAIALAKKEFPNLLIGAGTVINEAQSLQAIDYGASFIVSPGFSDEVLALCQEKGVLYVPGVATPTEIMHALSKGVDHLKFFPAEIYGGLAGIKALSSAFPQVRFLPTGGVGLANMSEFLSFEKIFAVGGSFLLKGNIAENCAKAKQIIGGK